MKNVLKNKSGFGIIEILLVISMAGIIIVSIGQSLASIHKLNTASEIKEKATSYAKQYLEMATELKIKNFANNLSSLSHFSPLSPEEGFLVEIKSTKLHRDENGNLIGETGGEEDQNTEKVTVTVKYHGLVKTELSTIFTNWRQN